MTNPNVGNIEVVGAKGLIDKLRSLYLGKKNREVVVIGYTARYALWVHERRGMKWKGLPRAKGRGVYWGPNGRAGFLLDVAREMQGELAKVCTQSLQKGVPLIKSLLMTGLRLQRESQKNVPILTGNLKNSAFTRVENE